MALLCSKLAGGDTSSNSTHTENGFLTRMKSWTHRCTWTIEDVRWFAETCQALHTPPFPDDDVSGTKWRLLVHFYSSSSATSLVIGRRRSERYLSLHLQLVYANRDRVTAFPSLSVTSMARSSIREETPVKFAVGDMWGRRDFLSGEHLFLLGTAYVSCDVRVVSPVALTTHVTPGLPTSVSQCKVRFPTSQGVFSKAPATSKNQFKKRSSSRQTFPSSLRSSDLDDY